MVVEIFSFLSVAENAQDFKVLLAVLSTCKWFRDVVYCNRKYLKWGKTYSKELLLHATAIGDVELAKLANKWYVDTAGLVPTWVNTIMCTNCDKPITMVESDYGDCCYYKCEEEDVFKDRLSGEVKCVESEIMCSAVKYDDVMQKAAEKGCKEMCILVNQWCKELQSAPGYTDVGNIHTTMLMYAACGGTAAHRDICTMGVKEWGLAPYCDIVLANAAGVEDIELCKMAHTWAFEKYGTGLTPWCKDEIYTMSMMKAIQNGNVELCVLLKEQFESVSPPSEWWGEKTYSMLSKWVLDHSPIGSTSKILSLIDEWKGWMVVSYRKRKN